MTAADIFTTWSRMVLAWQSGAADQGADPAVPPVCLRHGPQALARMASSAGAQRHRAAARAVSSFLRDDCAACLILGADAAFASSVLPLLPAHTPVVTIEPDAQRARAFAAACPQALLLTEQSPWALFLLLLGLGIAPERALLCRAPRLGEEGGDAATAQESRSEQVFGALRSLILGARPLAVRQYSGCWPLAVACIIHPDEPDVASFFRHIPPWVQEVCVVWDTVAPLHVPPCPVPLRQMTRPLHGDFGAQRNAMLDMVLAPWCLYLDADERLRPEDWERLPSLMIAAEAGGVGGIALPRRTYAGRLGAVRMGFGLWPDMQLRLFRTSPAPHFCGAINEKVYDYMGAAAFVADIPLLHYGQELKGQAVLRERLAECYAASSHIYSPHSAYPALPEAFFDALERQSMAGILWRLP